MDDRLFACHVRFDPEKGKKKILWWRNGKWTLDGRSSTEAPLYGSERVRGFKPEKPILLVEGEKCVDALTSIGAQAVGSVCGASSIPSREILLMLIGRDVILLPDNDDAGRDHMKRIGQELLAEVDS